MKKWIALLLALVMCLSLCACSSSQSISLDDQIEQNTEEASNSSFIVPDSFMAAEIMEFMTEVQSAPHSNAGSHYKEITYDITHNPDQSSNIDNVTITFFNEYEYGQLIYCINAVYQYYQDSETWGRLQASEPELIDYHLYEDSIIGQTMSGSKKIDLGVFELDEVDYSVTVVDFDQSTDTITVDYNLTGSMTVSGTDTFALSHNELGPIGFEIPYGTNGNKFWAHFGVHEITYDMN